jgi:hypothetical protein
MEQSFLEAESHGFPTFCDTVACYWGYNNPPMDSKLSQMNTNHPVELLP